MTGIGPDTSKINSVAASTLANGYYRLPPGRLANACIYLEMLQPPVPGTLRPTPPDMRLERLRGADAARFSKIYRNVGEAWLWAAHLTKSPEEVARLLDNASGETLVAAGPQGDIGLLQLEWDEKEGAEITYFGLLPVAIGKGIGRWLMDEAIARAFARPSHRLWLHTCNFDHPKALSFYQAAGFKIYAAGFEIMDDPRAKGLLPRTAAPHVPLVA
jgi:GNAT superfamily N-acetyltransferase